MGTTPPANARSRLLPFLGLILMAVSLGTGHVSSRLAFANGVNVATAASMRSLTAAVLLFGLLTVLGRRVFPLPAQFRSNLLLGLMIAVQTVLIQMSVSLMPVTLAILVFYTFPFLTGVASTLLGDERPTFRLFGALAATFVGLALVLGVQAGVSLAGVACAAGAAVAFTSALVMTPRLAPDIAAPLRTFFMLSTAAALFVGGTTAAGAWQFPVNAAGWAGLAGLAAFYAIGISGVFLLASRLGATQTAIGMNLEPVAVAIMAWLLLGESLGPLQIVGAAIVVGSVIAYQLRPGRA